MFKKKKDEKMLQAAPKNKFVQKEYDFIEFFVIFLVELCIRVCDAKILVKIQWYWITITNQFQHSPLKFIATDRVVQKLIAILHSGRNEKLIGAPVLLSRFRYHRTINHSPIYTLASPPPSDSLLFLLPSGPE